MEKNTYLDTINFKSINVVIATLSGLVTVVLALAPNTISTLLLLEYTVQTNGSWFNSNRIVLKFYCFFIGSLAISNFFGGIENSVPTHSVSFGLIGVMLAISSICWYKSRGVFPNTKMINSESKFSLLNSEEKVS